MCTFLKKYARCVLFQKSTQDVYIFEKVRKMCTFSKKYARCGLFKKVRKMWTFQKSTQDVDFSKMCARLKKLKNQAIFKF